MRLLLAVAAVLCMVGGTVGCNNGGDTPSTAEIKPSGDTKIKEGGPAGMQAAPVPSPTPQGG